MTPEQAAQLIKRARELGTESNYFTTSMSKLQVIYQYKQLVPDLANALETALARIDELERAALAFLAQQSQDLGLYDYYPEEEAEATEQPQPDQGQE